MAIFGPAGPQGPAGPPGGGVTSSAQGYRAVYGASGTVINGSAPSLDCSAFAGGDMSVKIQACLVALNTLNSQTGIADARNFTGTQTWSVNPLGGATMPTSGTLLLPGININENLPLATPNFWSVKGAASNGVYSQRGTVIRPSGSFHAWANPDTGTITTATANSTSGSTITGSGTSFSASMVGCELIAGSSIQNGSNVSVAGIIRAVASATSLTIGYNAPAGPGGTVTSASLPYAVQCALLETGAGASVVTNAAYQFGMAIRDIGLDCNDVLGCIGASDWFGEELTEFDHVQLRGYNNIGLLLATAYAQNGGPFHNLIFQAGTSCTPSTLGIVDRVNGGSMREISDFTYATPAPGCTGGAQAIAFDIETPQQVIQHGHFESVTNAINLGGSGGAALNCPIACPAGFFNAHGAMVDDVMGATNTGTSNILVHIASGQNNITLRDLDAQNTWLDVLSDSTNSCTDTDVRLGFYALDQGGNIRYSTANTGCTPESSTSYAGTVTVTGATIGSTNLANAFNSAPSCTIVPTTDPTSVGGYRVTTSRTAITANVHTSGTITFKYVCVGNPN